MNTFDTKATDNAFEAGDAIGIFAGTPIDAVNVKGTVSGSSITLENPLFWGEGQTDNTTFAAYLPYDASLSSTTTSFAVKNDQSSYANYQASDLLAATVSAAPRTTVALAMKHQLSKLVVIPTCEDATETVSSVTIQELVTEATADLTAKTVVPGSAKGTVKAGEAVSGNGGQGFVSILVPQTIQLKLSVTTSAGRTLAYTLAEPATLESGKAYKAEITVKEAGTPLPPDEDSPVEFTISIVDWEDGGALVFVDDEPGEVDHTGQWSVIGQLNGTSWDTDFWMTETSEGVWEIDITYLAGDSFKLRQDGKWSTGEETHAEAGMPAAAEGTVPTDGSEYGLWGSDNKDIVLAAPGEYHLKFIAEGYKFYVTGNAEPSDLPQISDLYLLGEATDAGWGLNLMPQFTKNGNVFTLTANLQANKEFRFLTQKIPNPATWWPSIVKDIATGAPVYCESQEVWDANNTAWTHYSVGETGSYEIVFNADAWTVTFTRKGDTVDPGVEFNEIYIIGAAIPTGWALDLAPQLDKNGDVYTITIHLDGNAIFRFLTQKDWYPAIVAGDAEGKARYTQASVADSEHFKVTVSGTYSITLNVADMTISFVLDEADPVAPTAVTIYVDDQTGWEVLSLYMWGDVDDFGGGWAGKLPTGTEVIGGVTYKTFEYGEDIFGLTEHLIFNNTLGGEGNQVADYIMTFTEGVSEYYFRVTKTEVTPVE